jgi:hypothetical protein
MIKIVPSETLSTVSVSKLQTRSCQRKYFWRYVMNLEPKGLSVALWFGSMVHAGLEVRLEGGNAKMALLAMKRTDREKLKGLSGMSADTLAEMEIWRAIGPAMVEGFVAKYGSHILLAESEIPFEMKLACGVTFRGLIDGLGTYDGESTLFEFKALGQIASTTFDTMAFNGQVFPYLSTIPKDRRPKKFAFCVLRKPSKWVKKGQSLGEFVAEIKEDLIARPDFYFAVWTQDVGEQAIQYALADVEAGAEDLRAKYKRLGKCVLDPFNWPRDDRACHEYGSCTMLSLCKDTGHWEARAATMFQHREDQFPTVKEIK